MPLRPFTTRAACRLAAAGLLAGGLLTAPFARAQVDSREAIALQNQILQLRHQLDQLQQGGAPVASTPLPPPVPPGSGGASSDLLPQLLDRTTALEDAVRDLRGRVEALENAQARQAADLGKQIGDLAFQVQQMQGAAPPAARAPATVAAPPPTQSPPPASLGTVPAGPAATARRTPELAMQEGNAALARRDYAAAEAAAQEVLKQGRGPRSYDAQFLLAQALAGERNWRDAALAYDDAYNRGPSAGHAQDSLLGMANALYALNDRKAACVALDKLRTQFPQPRGDLRDSIAASRVRSGCH